MSTVFESTAGNLAPKTNGNGAGTATRRNFRPLGLNAQKVIAKRYSMKDEHGEAIETWEDIVRRVVGHVSTAEKDPQRQVQFYNDMTAVMLDREFVPRWYIEYVVYHEMLHAFVPDKYDAAGRRVIHHEGFVKRERKFRHYQAAIQWEQENLGRFLR